jgi:NADH:ubiquinone oxidoreductase subunit C
MFVYDSPTSRINLQNFKKSNDSSLQAPSARALNENIIVYNFHNFLTNNRFFVFSYLSATPQTSKRRVKTPSIRSITELYPNAWWLEREIAELHDINFINKKDTRNLMLQYGDTSAPFKKNNPSIGLKEIFYDVVSDSLIYSPVSLQF